MKKKLCAAYLGFLTPTRNNKQYVLARFSKGSFPDEPGIEGRTSAVGFIVH